MLMLEEFLKTNSSDLSSNNFCLVNVLNLVVKLILIDSEFFRAIKFIYDEFSSLHVTSIVVFDIENVNRVNCVFKY